MLVKLLLHVDIVLKLVQFQLDIVSLLVVRFLELAGM